MPATKRLVLDLPEETVDLIEARVAAGEFATADELVSTALEDFESLPDDDPDFEAWLRRGDEVVARLKAGREPTSPLTEAFDRVRAKLLAQTRNGGAARG